MLGSPESSGYPVSRNIPDQTSDRVHRASRAADFHPAVDISTQKGRPVYATATGRVFSAGRNGHYGNLVEIDHGFDLTTRYGHLSDFAVVVGDTVQRGEVIGYVGATGRATGYHVHYEVWSAGRSIDPRRLLAQSRTTSAN